MRVWDACDADTLLGKQVDEWYTHSGGIWQPVWLEGRPAAYIAQAHVTPHLETGRRQLRRRRGRHRARAPPGPTGWR